MAVVVNATPGDPAANSFTTQAFATEYNTGVMNPEAWVNAASDTKNRALISATQTIISNVRRWIGRAATDAQALPFPRLWAYTANGFLLSSTVVPIELQRATAELARRLIESGGVTSASGSTTLKELKAGPVNLKFRDDAPVSSGFPDDVFKMIAHLTEASPESSGIRFAPVVRT